MTDVRLTDLVDPEKVAQLRAAVAGNPEPPGPFESKGAGTSVELERKADPGLGGAQVLSADDSTGVVEALVSVTGVEDRVKDVIEPGAYTKTIGKHEPIGVWSHDDKTWVARTENAVELMPGDPFFKGLTTMDGQPWPAQAGAVKVRARFNLETTHGREAYSDVKFFQGKTGWSIGYRATKAHRNPRTGVRHIKELDWFEYSPVMVGAASQPMTLSVKSLAQPVDPDEGVDLVDVDELTEDEVKARDALREYLEVKASVRHVRTAAGARHFGQPIGSVIVKDVVRAMDVEVGDLVDFQGMGPGGPSDPKPVKGHVDAVSRDGNVVTLKVGGESHKLGSSNPIQIERAKPQPGGGEKPEREAVPDKPEGPITNAQLQKLFGEAETPEQKEKVRAALALPEEQRRAFLAGEKPVAGGGKPDPTRTGSLASRMRADEAAGEAADAEAGKSTGAATSFPVGSSVEFEAGWRQPGVMNTGKVTGHMAAGGGFGERVKVSSPEVGDIVLDVEKLKKAGGGDKPKAPAAGGKGIPDGARNAKRQADGSVNPSENGPGGTAGTGTGLNQFSDTMAGLGTRDLEQAVELHEGLVASGKIPKDSGTYHMMLAMKDELRVRSELGVTGNGRGKDDGKGKDGGGKPAGDVPEGVTPEAWAVVQEHDNLAGRDAYGDDRRFMQDLADSEGVELDDLVAAVDAQGGSKPDQPTGKKPAAAGKAADPADMDDEAIAVERGKVEAAIEKERDRLAGEGWEAYGPGGDNSSRDPMPTPELDALEAREDALAREALKRVGLPGDRADVGPSSAPRPPRPAAGGKPDQKPSEPASSKYPSDADMSAVKRAANKATAPGLKPALSNLAAEMSGNEHTRAEAAAKLREYAGRHTGDAPLLNGLADRLDGGGSKPALSEQEARAYANLQRTGAILTSDKGRADKLAAAAEADGLKVKRTEESGGVHGVVIEDGPDARTDLTRGADGYDRSPAEQRAAAKPRAGRGLTKAEKNKLADDLGLDTLETRNSDDLDFHEVGLDNLRATAEKVYGGKLPANLTPERHEATAESVKYAADQGGSAADFPEFSVAGLTEYLDAVKKAAGAKEKDTPLPGQSRSGSSSRRSGPPQMRQTTVGAGRGGDDGEAARKREQRAQRALASDRAGDAEADARVRDRAKLAALNKRRRAQGKLPLLRLPDGQKALDLDALEFAADVADLESKGSSASLDRSPRSNWVEKSGDLPAYIREVARGIEKAGHPLSSAIPMAISRIKRWATGGDGVKPDTVAKAVKAVAEWEALKAKNRTKFDSELLAELEQKALDLEDAVDDAWAFLWENEFKAQVGTSPDYVQVDPDTGEVVGTASVDPDEPLEGKALLSPDELQKANELRRALLN